MTAPDDVHTPPDASPGTPEVAPPDRPTPAPDASPFSRPDIERIQEGDSGDSGSAYE